MIIVTPLSAVCVHCSCSPTPKPVDTYTNNRFPFRFVMSKFSNVVYKLKSCAVRLPRGAKEFADFADRYY